MTRHEPLAVKAQTAAPRRAARATEAAIRRAITAWRNAGLAVGAVEVAPDGTIRITTPVDQSAEPAHRAEPKKWRG
jgi:hypothetical protein